MALWLALLLGVWGAALGLSGAALRRGDLSASGERGVHAATVFIAIAIAGLARALFDGDLTYRYVASWTASGMAAPYRVAALWVGPSGALLVWALALGVGAVLAALTMERGSALRAWTSGLLAVLMAAVIAMACFDANPFKRLPFPPDDGRGMPLEWLRPIVLLEMPVGYIAMSLVAVPAVITVMGALGTAPWHGHARRWSAIAWASTALAVLLDWRRRYGDAAWSDAWQWAPVHSGSALAFAGAAVLVVLHARRASTSAALAGGFVAFTLGLAGVALRRAFGWSGLLEFAASSAATPVAWVAFAAVLGVAAYGLWSLRGARGVAARAMQGAHGATLLVAGALALTTAARTVDVAIREGQRERVADRFGTAWTLSLEGVSQVGREAVLSNVVAVRAAVNGKARAFVTAEVRSLFSADSRDAADQVVLSGIASGLAQDLRVDVREANTADAVLTVKFIPAVRWLWLAGAVLVLAAIVAGVAPPAQTTDASTPEAA